MQRSATKPMSSAPMPGMPRQRQAPHLRPPQQLVQNPRRVTPPDGLAPGVVRRVSATPKPAGPSPEAVCAAAEIPIAVPQPLNPVDFCRQARRLRAVHENDPQRMHQRLSRLSATEAGEGNAAPTPMDVDAAYASRSSKAIRWTWTQTAKLGKGGVTLLSKLGRGLSMGAESEADAPAGEMKMEDEEPQYTLVDPEDPLPADQGYANTTDRNFAQLVNRTLRKQHTAVLRYSDRLELLKEAGRRGIGRFEANLMIASVQHRLSAGMPLPKERRPIRMQTVLAFVLMQGMILWGFWRILKT